MAPTETPLGEKYENLYIEKVLRIKEKYVDVGQAIPTLHFIWSIFNLKVQATVHVCYPSDATITNAYQEQAHTLLHLLVRRR